MTGEEERADLFPFFGGLIESEVLDCAPRYQATTGEARIEEGHRELINTPATGQQKEGERLIRGSAYLEDTLLDDNLAMQQ
jgi:hypothetical protein